MAAFRKVTERFAVSPQICTADVAEAAADGVTLIINNRPDGEAPDQTPGAVIEAAARSVGLDYAHVPIVGRPGEQDAAQVRRLIETTPGKVLAYCRSGTRSITAWALAMAPTTPKEEIVRAGAVAGYDLTRLWPG